MADILTNPKARRDFHILETFEAGIVLRGTEVKALRAGKGQLSDAFARVENGEVYLYNAHIDEYAHGNLQNHQPKAVRKLLLHKSEIRKLFGLAAVKGNALLPLSFYWKNGRVKVALSGQRQSSVRQTRGPQGARGEPRTQTGHDATPQKRLKAPLTNKSYLRAAAFPLRPNSHLRGIFFLFRRFIQPLFLVLILLL